MSKQFASLSDTEDKTITFSELAEGVYAYTAEGDPNTGVIIGDHDVMVIDTQATPDMAQDVIRRIREVTEKPIRHIVMSHYHAVRVLGATAYTDAVNVIASQDTFDLVVERGQQDFDSEAGRFPRLFQGLNSIPGLTWPTVVFKKELVLQMGKRTVKIMQIGRGHTKGDTVVWLPEERILFSGDLVEYEATPYSGDAYHRDWPQTLDNLKALGAQQIVPGRGDALTTPKMCQAAIEGTQSFIREMYGMVEAGRRAGKTLAECYQETHPIMQKQYGHYVIFEHCIPFNISRCYDEAGEHPDPQIWTAERDQQMWHDLQSVVG